MRKLQDETPVEFTASCGIDGKLYSLVITCEAPLNEEEYALCLISFAEDIIEKRFSFKTAETIDTLSQ